MLEPPPQGYVRNVPLPRVPLRQSTTTSQAHMILNYYEVLYIVPTYNTPHSIVESAAYAFSPAWHAIAINTGNNLLSNLSSQHTMRNHTRNDNYLSYPQTIAKFLAAPADKQIRCLSFHSVLLVWGVKLVSS